MEKIGKKSIDKIGKKFISIPVTGRILKKGDKMNNLYFVGYVKNLKSMREKWCNSESWWHLSVRETLRGAKRRALQNNIPFNITSDDLKSIWPSDGLCPVFNSPMTFSNKNKWRSASLDRIDPDKGYVPGNIQWISTKANTLKSNAHPYELMRLARYMVNQLKEQEKNAKK
ncbi:endonuclease [uncultured phage_MedDCM-OCT-S28-C10]|uniref:Endonuclease n=1 Tax=uncultured phage_MedDCM-OCT-S28-C10 TaxID=2741077 RepID=A0A6S4P7Q9_9CAUD|nr:endonuclease [uncultured phage_MedDCM-OCT-S28-C10]BAQ94091.1 endonuclease [uncultured phage_MedDCM-OCT-S28-C10]BAR25293.1 unnamed protein product [uncultured Mediterranean phage uvMED]BAR25350.1 unnamed protein product [uncultured Mediterranean phage uvMED]